VAGTAMAQAFDQGPLPPAGPSSLAITGVTEPAIPASAVGRNLLTIRNDTLGVIVTARNDGLILRSGNAMRIVPRSHVFFTGSGSDVTVRSIMTGDDVAALPRYIPPTAASLNR